MGFPVAWAAGKGLGWAKEESIKVPRSSGCRQWGKQKNGDRSSLRPFPCVVGSVCGTAPHVGCFFFVAWSWVGARRKSVGDGETRTTSNGGPLGSCVDEERRELRYVV